MNSAEQSLTIVFEPLAITADTIPVIGVWRSRDADSAGELNERVPGAPALGDAVERTHFKGDFGTIRECAVTRDKATTFCLLLGLGQRRSLSVTELEHLGGHVLERLRSLERPRIRIALDPDIAVGRVAAHFAFGARCCSYEFNRYRHDPGTSYLSELGIQCDAAEQADSAYSTFSKVAAGIDLARDMVNQPPNFSTPPILTQELEELEKLGLGVAVHRPVEENQKQFPGTWAVGRASVEAPAVVVLEWRGPGGDRDISLALAGKGVTFDAGGLTLKPQEHQFHMKTDLGGAAAVIGAMHAIASIGIDYGVVGIVGLAENLPGPDAFRSGDILTMADGRSVEISFPDAEGRLILADLLTHVREFYEPDKIIDLATLTYTVIAALGTKMIGLFCNDDGLAQELRRAADVADEPIWRLPVSAEYLESLESNVADLKNMPAAGRLGGLEGSASVAAAFLQSFVSDTPWAHLDIAGTVWRDKASTKGPVGGTGSGVRLLVELVEQYASKSTSSDTGII